jgi:hypothetical protein
MGSSGSGKPSWDKSSTPLANINQACPPKSLERARLQINDPGIAFVTIQKIALGGAVADLPLNLPFPCNWIMVASIDPVHVSDSLYLHFKPLYKAYGGGNGVTVVGNENWLPMQSQTATQNKTGIGYRFTNPLPINCYLDIGQEAGGGNYFITFAVGNDVNFWTRD